MNQLQGGSSSQTSQRVSWDGSLWHKECWEPQTLLKGRVNTMSNQQCKKTKWEQSTILDSKICAESPGRDACQGGDLCSTEQRLSLYLNLWALECTGLTRWQRGSSSRGSRGCRGLSADRSHFSWIPVCWEWLSWPLHQGHRLPPVDQRQ